MKTRNPSLDNDDFDTGRDDSVVGGVSHPIAATIGALAAGGATGAVVGTAAGPVGTAVGAVVGAVAGALGADAVASSIEQVSDSGYSRDMHEARKDVAPGWSFEDYAGAYAFGADIRRRYPEQHFVRLDSRLADEWPRSRGESRLSWNQARAAAREAWERG